MKTSLRSLLSATAGLGLSAFTIVSAFTAGFEAGSTVIAFSLLVIYGLLEIAMVSYAAPRYELRTPMRREALTAMPALARVSPLVSMSAPTTQRRAA